MNELSRQQEKLLSDLQSDAFQYFIHEVNPDNGLVVDSTKGGWPSSIAAVGMALSVYPVGVEHGFITRAEAIERSTSARVPPAESPVMAILFRPLSTSPR